jgi:hypothetical protein
MKIAQRFTNWFPQSTKEKGAAAAGRNALSYWPDLPKWERQGIFMPE